MTAKPSPRKRELLVYFLLAYGIAWLIWLPVALGQNGLGVIPVAVPIFPWGALGTVGPMTAAFLTQKICQGNLRAFRLWTSLRQILVGTIAGVFCLLVARWLLSAVGLTRSGYGAWNWAALLDIRYSLIPNILSGPLGEEPGWRGFGLPRLQSGYNPTNASLLLGVIWSGWHLPLFFVHDWTTAPFWVFAGTMTGFSVILSFGYNVSGGSVIVPIIMHDVFNCGGTPLYSMLAKATLRRNPDLIVSCAFAITATALIVLTRRRLTLKDVDKRKPERGCAESGSRTLVPETRSTKIT